jgi:hypothetical protein
MMIAPRGSGGGRRGAEIGVKCCFDILLNVNFSVKKSTYTTKSVK